MFFHSLVADLFGLTVADWRAWDIVVRHGPIAAGELAQRIGLTPGAVTGLIDRLHEAGAVERVRDQQDRRKVLVRATVQLKHQERANVLLAPMAQALERLYERYSDAQLRMMAGFMTQIADLLREQTADLMTKSLRSEEEAIFGDRHKGRVTSG